LYIIFLISSKLCSTLESRRLATYLINRFTLIFVSKLKSLVLLSNITLTIVSSLRNGVRIIKLCLETDYTIKKL